MRKSKAALVCLTALVFASTLVVATPPNGTPSARADDDLPLNSAAALAINVPSSVLADAGPSAVTASRLAAGQAFDWRFTDPNFASVSGTLTSAPADASALSAEEAATWSAMVEDFAAPAIRAAPVSRVVGSASLPVLSFTAGLLIGNGASRVAGFKDDAVCQERNGVLTALASVLNGVDCTAYNNAMSAVERNADQYPVVTMDPTSRHGFTVKYVGGVPYPNLDTNWLTCFKYTGKSSDGYTIAGVAVWGANGTSNGTGSGLANPNCGTGSNLSGWWIKAPLMHYQVGYKKGNATDLSPVASGTYVTPNPQRRFLCSLLLADGTESDAESAPYTEQDANLAGISCPAPPPGGIVARVIISDQYAVNQSSNQQEQLLDVPTTDAYKQWADQYPECTNGSCLTDLRKDGASCFRQVNVNACAGWFTSGSPGDHYTCYVGTHLVDLSECKVYAQTFDGTAADDGHGYSDPGTGATQTDPTTPTKRQRLTIACENVIAQRATSSTQTVGALAGVTQQDCDQMPIYIPGSELRTATTHRASAIAANPAWIRLNYESRTQKTNDLLAAGAGTSPSAVQTWYNGTNECASRAQGQSCDEFPNYATSQGASVRSWTDTPLSPLVSLSLVPSADNSAEGGRYGAFVAACNLTSASAAAPNAPGSAFLEIPTPTSPTDYICAPS